MDIVYKLIEHDIHPLYHYGTMFYFVRTEKFEKYMSIIRHKSLGKEESDAIKAM